MTKTIVLGGGCFWCTEAVFKMIKGIISIMPGYAGGTVAQPTYEAVCNGTTGHAEVVRIEYDPSIISFNDILTIFFASHNPTTMNRQGHDVGTQYRSIILYSSEEEKVEAEKFITELNNSAELGDPIVTEVKPLETFYEAEEYHRDYYAKHPEQAYCQAVINPKLAKVKEKFGKFLQTQS
jgi:peptide-methionine (S)-S-oxide reductase